MPYMCRLFWVTIFITFVSAGSGCSIFHTKVSSTIEMGEKPEILEEAGWWRVSFQMRWPEQEDRQWHLDLLLAHRVIAPVLEQNRKDIFLWRFHRRAARDRLGHRFSFIFFCKRKTAQDIYLAIGSDKSVIDMKAAGIIEKESFSDIRKNSKPDIEDTSDPKWSQAMKKSWPYYIMGVSEMWLKLVDEFASEAFEGCNDPVSEWIDSYREVEKKITLSWQEEGRHALLHHLNAMFQYEPVIVYEKRLMNF